MTEVVVAGVVGVVVTVGDGSCVESLCVSCLIISLLLCGIFHATKLTAKRPMIWPGG